MAGVVVIGAGPGIGAAMAWRFAKEGLPVALVARRRASVDSLVGKVSGVRTAGFIANAADEVALRAALDSAAAEFGVPDALVYNAAIIRLAGGGNPG